MSAEITVSAALEVNNGIINEALSKSGIRFDLTGSKFTKTVQAIGTSEEAINLGEVSGSLGWCLAINLDNTNFVSLKTATSGVKFAKLLAKGGVSLFYFGTDITAPFAIADTAACNVAFLILTQ